MGLRPRAGVLVPAPRLAVNIHGLSEVPHLRDAVVRHHLTEWPKPEGRLDPATWGNLGDPTLTAREDHIPLTLVATLDGRYVGQGSIIARDLDHRLYRDRGPWMGGLCVVREYRGNGIGKKLHFERLRMAAEMGIPELFLFTERRPYPTVELYRRFGWEVECELPDFDDGSTTERRWVMTVKPSDLFQHEEG